MIQYIRKKFRYFSMVKIKGPYELPFYKNEYGILWGNVRQHIWVPFRVYFPLKEVFPFKVKSESIIIEMISPSIHDIMSS